MDYKSTILLPKTAFPMQAGLPQNEPKIRERWEKEDLYGQIRKARAGRPKYILHDGPPYANGDVHSGTGQNKILKDIVVRYKTLRGFDAPYVPGWDCHGLPIEHNVTKELGPKAKTLSKPEIRKLCHDYATKWLDTQRRQFKSLGVLGDWEKPYTTFDPRYEAAIVDLFADLHAKGHVYKRLRPIHWCMNCETALAEAELEYEEKTSPSIFIRFELMNSAAADGAHPFPDPVKNALLDGKKVHIAVWTTTPWTLHGNVAIAVHPGESYGLYRMPDGEYVILAVKCTDRFRETCKGTFWDGEMRLESEFPGASLGSAPDTGLYAYKRCFAEPGGRIVCADYVTMTDGTGCVHTAPGHGAEDYETGLAQKLEILSPVDPRGVIGNPGHPGDGMRVFDANPTIIQHLAQKNILIRQQEIRHSYPHCWRCKKPVIFRATEQWFVGVDVHDGRKRLLDAIRKDVKWIPPWGESRITGMVQDRPDWCVSRQRSWGVPIPAFYCDASGCGGVVMDATTLAAVRDLFVREGANAWFTKKPEEILPTGTKCPKCGGAKFRQENDIFDVWFESGASHRAVLMDREKFPDLQFPADLYLEGTDQHRGWFQVSLIPSVFTQGKPPFKAVLTHGFIVDPATGEKGSKSKGNIILADDLVKKVGSDLVRLWIASLNFTDDIPCSLPIIQERAEPYRKIRNTFRYLLGNLADFDPAKDRVPPEKLTEIDRWARAVLHRLIGEVTARFDAFEFHRVFQEIYQFCTVEMSSFYLDVLKDRLYCAGRSSPERRAAQTVMHEILSALVRMIAPILVHTAEEIWGHVPGARESGSVHAALWPEADPKAIHEGLIARWERIMRIREDVSREIEKLRAAKTVGSSQEVRVTLSAVEPELLSFLKAAGPLWRELSIVADVVVADAPPDGASAGGHVPALRIRAEKASTLKCERCWAHRETVGKAADHPGLCERCAGVVRALA